VVATAAVVVAAVATVAVAVAVAATAVATEAATAVVISEKHKHITAVNVAAPAVVRRGCAVNYPFRMSCALRAIMTDQVDSGARGK
jgi:hypothetical protein